MSPPPVVHLRMPSRMRTSNTQPSSSLTRLLLVHFHFDIEGRVGWSKSSWSTIRDDASKHKTI